MRDRRLRVRLVSNSRALGGAELYTLELASALREGGDAVRVSTPGDSALFARAAERGVPADALELGPKLGRSTAAVTLLRWQAHRRVLLDHLKEGADDVVILQFKKEQLLWGGSSLSLPPVAIFEHGPIPRPIASWPLVRSRYRRALEAASLLVAAGPVAADALRQLRPEVDVVIVSAGFDASRAEMAVAAAPEAREELVARTGLRRVLVSSSQLARARGVEEALRLVAGLPDFGLAVLGEGPDRGRLEELARSLGVEERTWFAGFVGEPLRYAAAAEAVVSLGHAAGEGRPLRLLEAVAVGRRIIASDTAAHRAFAVEFPEHTRLVSSDSPAAIAEILATPPPCFAVGLPTWSESAAYLRRALIEALPPT